MESAVNLKLKGTGDVATLFGLLSSYRTMRVVAYYIWTLLPAVITWELLLNMSPLTFVVFCSVGMSSLVTSLIMMPVGILITLLSFMDRMASATSGFV
jgi:hypothetical protein